MGRSAGRCGLRRLPGLVQAPAGSALLEKAGQALAVVRLLSGCVCFGAPVVHPVQAALACATATLDAGLQMSTCLLLVHDTKYTVAGPQCAKMASLHPSNVSAS